MSILEKLRERAAGGKMILLTDREVKQLAKELNRLDASPKPVKAYEKAIREGSAKLYGLPLKLEVIVK